MLQNNFLQRAVGYAKLGPVWCTRWMVFNHRSSLLYTSNLLLHQRMLFNWLVNWSIIFLIGFLIGQYNYHQCKHFII